MCTALLPPVVNQIAYNEIYHIIIYHIEMYLRKVVWEGMEWIYQGDVRAGRLSHKDCSPPRNFERNCTKYLNKCFH
jgi:hypothetical protein